MYKLKEINFESTVKLKLSKNNIPVYSTVVYCDENILRYIYDYEFEEIPTEDQLLEVIAQHTIDHASNIPYIYSINDKRPYIKCEIDDSIISCDDYAAHGFEWNEVDRNSINTELFNYEFKEA